MSAYRMVQTRLLRPAAQAAAGAPAQGEWVNAEPAVAAEVLGAFRPMPAVAVASLFGLGARQVFRWRGVLPDDVRPEPGWELQVRGARYRVLTAAPSIGRTWRLDVESVGDR